MPILYRNEPRSSRFLALYIHRLSAVRYKRHPVSLVHEARTSDSRRSCKSLYSNFYKPFEPDKNILAYKRQREQYATSQQTSERDVSAYTEVGFCLPHNKGYCSLNLISVIDYQA